MVAYKLAWAIANEFSPGTKLDPQLREFMLNATSLAAMGTIADVVDLRGENRVLTSFGLKSLPDCKLCGGAGIKLCPACKGSGRQEGRSASRFAPCPTCRGTGAATCGACGGRGGATCTGCQGPGQPTASRVGLRPSEVRRLAELIAIARHLRDGGLDLYSPDALHPSPQMLTR